MYYNFARVHKTLGITPAMAASMADHAWAIEVIVSLGNSHFEAMSSFKIFFHLKLTHYQLLTLQMADAIMVLNCPAV
jgi:hypothetical protein